MDPCLSAEDRGSRDMEEEEEKGETGEGEDASEFLHRDPGSTRSSKRQEDGRIPELGIFSSSSIIIDVGPWTWTPASSEAHKSSRCLGMGGGGGYPNGFWLLGKKGI
ncbi:hypothetical protein D9757_014899 [Collybiopsis confluens]|uniref:Uncharacterized protein n=1 Tax=Collybiopsis confluens TaxID=2823264 RepID=A0A8H5FQJ4_9AGAR|nr:hypothetical protein D9757_014899 [Collybiopsis confluens]